MQTCKPVCTRLLHVDHKPRLFSKACFLLTRAALTGFVGLYNVKGSRRDQVLMGWFQFLPQTIQVPGPRWRASPSLWRTMGSRCWIASRRRIRTSRSTGEDLFIMVTQIKSSSNPCSLNPTERLRQILVKFPKIQNLRWSKVQYWNDSLFYLGG